MNWHNVTMCSLNLILITLFFFQAEDGIRDWSVTGVQTCALPICGGWIQAERGARPAQAVLLVEDREAYLAGEPADDGRFLAAFAHALEHTGGYPPVEARRVAGTLLQIGRAAGRERVCISGVVGCM